MKISKRPRSVSAWAAVGKKSGKMLYDLHGQYALYSNFNYAQADCPDYGEIRAVSVRVLPRARDVRGILKGRCRIK